MFNKILLYIVHQVNLKMSLKYFQKLELILDTISANNPFLTHETIICNDRDPP